MNKQIKAAAISFLLFATGAVAQTTVTGTGTANTVPLFTGSSTLGNSNITQSNGSIGIDTTSPASWSGVSNISGSNLQIFGNGTNARLIINSTINDAAELHLVDSAAPQNKHNHRFYADNAGLFLDQPTDTYSSSTVNMFWSNNGSVGIGTSNPGSPLEVNGNITITHGSTGALVFADGTSLSSAAGLVTSSSGSITSLGTVTSGVWHATPLTSAYLPSDIDYIDQVQTITARKSFMGNVGIGTTSPPLAPLDVAGTQTIQSPAGGHYLINYGLGGSAEDPNTGDIILLVPASGGSPVAGSQFAGIIQSNRGSTGSWNLNSQWYVSVQSAYTNNTGSITPLSGQQEYSTIPTLVTCVYNGQTYIGFRTPPGNSSSQWSLNGNWSNGQNNQTPALMTSSAVSKIVPLVSYESLGSQISMIGIGSTGNTNGIGSSVNVGIGTTSPSATLEVNGSVKLTQGSGASMTYPDGTVQSTAWNGTLPGGDYAESIDVQGDRTTYEPGDVIVIDPTAPGKFIKSEKAYSKLVAGVFSTKPGLVGRRATTARLDKEAEVPMAMMGIVPIKVSLENGPIEPGDLLVSASTPGYAMKGTDSARLTGAVIGKALAPLMSGSGVIEVLISLQ